ncbi:MAG: hypothetical protein IT342_08595 [Candidatus Melainabacteria bacterium]|nr:hypothetical protein [Candidatus Melainabacteria bacterium]
MIDYLDFVLRIDAGLSGERLRIWRQLTLTNGRPIGIYAAGEKGKFGGISLHFFLTYIKTASPDDFERFSSDCLEYALKANQIPAAKQLISSCLVLPCIATHTTFRELVLAAERAEKLDKSDSKKKAKGQKSGFLETAIMPCLLNLTTHKSFHSGTQSGFTCAIFNAGQEFLLKNVVCANFPLAEDAQHR